MSDDPGGRGSLGAVSSPSPVPDGPSVPGGPGGPGRSTVPMVVAAAPARPAGRQVLLELRSDLRGAVVWAGLLGLTGLVVGLLWARLAPRARFEVVEGGAVPLGRPSAELLVADDAVLVLLLVGLGLLAESATRRRLVTESRMLRRELTLLETVGAVPAPLQQFAGPTSLN